METYIILIFASLLIIQLFLYILKSYKNKFLLEIASTKSKNLFLEEEKAKQDIRISELTKILEAERDLKYEFSTKNELLLAKIKEQNILMQEWELLKNQSIEHAKAAIFEVGNVLSSKLMEDHKRESDEITKKNQEKFKETSEMLNQKFENIVQSVSVLNDQIKDSKQTVDVVKQALLNPQGAGNLAEITLENILKNSNLLSGTDYVMQYSFTANDEGNKLRPDAVVFLPGDNLIIIDSKASKFFTQMVDQENVDVLKEKLKISMNNHLKQLISKNYKDELKSSISQRKKINHISMIMFLPTESALEKIHDIDNEFMNKAWVNNIYPAGPIGLINILSHAKFQITQNNQVENYNVIIQEVNSLLDNLSTLHDHARKIGSSLQSASVHFDKFAGTFNTKIVSKSKKLVNLGILSKSKKNTPDLIERYQVISADKFAVVEGEPESNEDLVKELV